MVEEKSWLSRARVLLFKAFCRCYSGVSPECPGDALTSLWWGGWLPALLWSQGAGVLLEAARALQQPLLQACLLLPFVLTFLGLDLGFFVELSGHLDPRGRRSGCYKKAEWSRCGWCSDFKLLLYLNLSYMRAPANSSVCCGRRMSSSSRIT